MKTRAMLAALALAACAKQTPSEPQVEPDAPSQAQGEPEAQSTSDGYLYPTLSTMAPAPDGADGSGCLADSAPLADGAWFGYPTAWHQGEITLDSACMYSGAAAVAQAEARGEESPPPNDFIIVNDSPHLHTIPVGPGARAVRVTHDAEGGIATEFTTYEDLLAKPSTYQSCPGDGCPIWVFVEGGFAVEVAQQYLP